MSTLLQKFYEEVENRSDLDYREEFKEIIKELANQTQIRIRDKRLLKLNEKHFRMIEEFFAKRCLEKGISPSLKTLCMMMNFLQR